MKLLRRHLHQRGVRLYLQLHLLPQPDEILLEWLHVQVRALHDVLRQDLQRHPQHRLDRAADVQRLQKLDQLRWVSDTKAEEN